MSGHREVYICSVSYGSYILFKNEVVLIVFSDTLHHVAFYDFFSSVRHGNKITF